MLPELSFKTKGKPTACNGSRVNRVTCAKCSSYALALALTVALAIITGASHSNPTIERLPNLLPPLPAHLAASAKQRKLFLIKINDSFNGRLGPGSAKHKATIRVRVQSQKKGNLNLASACERVYALAGSYSILSLLSK